MGAKTHPIKKYLFVMFRRMKKRKEKADQNAVAELTRE